jgi:hypothetical protein
MTIHLVLTLRAGSAAWVNPAVRERPPLDSGSLNGRSLPKAKDYHTSRNNGSPSWPLPLRSLKTDVKAGG